MKVKEKYKKSEALKELEREFNEHKRKEHPTLPDHAFVYTKFRDDSANSLTSSIMAFLKLNGCYVQRVNTTGTWSQKLKKYIYSGSTRGAADLTAIIGKGKHVSIEIKFGQDKVSEKQKEVKAQIEAAGGIYYIARNYQEFYNWFNENFNN